jgi:glyoxylase-like metal-dependent hydrolase (beta-lactamase superfamily II)
MREMRLQIPESETKENVMAKISALNGNSQWLDGGAMFGNAPRSLWEKWLKPDSANRVPLACRSLLIQDEGLNILCEAGIGAFFEPKLAERYGVREKNHVLLQQMKARNLPEDAIDYVILSHLHFDHVGGLLPAYSERIEKGDRLLFPKAQYVVSRVAWERAQRPHSRDQASFIPEVVKLLADSGRLVIIDGPHLPGVLPGRLEFFETHGHTPGHMHTKYRGLKHTVVFAGDLVPGVPWIHLPITMGYDRYAELVIDEKAQFYQKALAEDWRIFFTHDERYAMAGLCRDEKGRFAPEPHKLWLDDGVQDMPL